MSKKLVPFKLPNSGVTVQVVGVSKIALLLQIRKEFPAPNAPMVLVNIAGEDEYERNEADPDYIEAMKLWDSKTGIESMERMVKRIAAKQTLTAEQKKEVDELREELSDEMLPGSDKLLWLTESAIGGDDDLEALINKATGQADPSQEGVNQAKKNF